MGACDFIVKGSGPTLRKAFSATVESALHEHGHGGYTGTIAEKNDVVLLGEAETEEEALDKANELIDHPKVEDKWGPAGAIRISNTNEYIFFGWASS